MNVNIKKVIKDNFDNLEYTENEYVFEDSEVDDIVYDLKSVFENVCDDKENFDLIFDDMFDDIRDMLVEHLKKRAKNRLEYLKRKDKVCTLDMDEFYELEELEEYLYE